MSFDLHPFVLILTLGVAVAFFVMVCAGIKRSGMGESATISENTGPPLFEFHFGLMGVVALLSTWLAFPIWLLLLCFRELRVSWYIHTLEAVVFGAGWLLTFVAFCWSKCNQQGGHSKRQMRNEPSLSAKTQL